ncbi:MAG: signal peptidase I [Candidatus Omnitrophica bacterium]|nr:signal peptidase I [Candidatus Omnitrophota bacterium]
MEHSQEHSGHSHSRLHSHKRPAHPARNKHDRQELVRYLIDEWVKPIAIALALALVIRAYIVQAYKIPTGSMRSTLLENDKILVDKVSYRFHDPQRGDVIVFKYPQDPKKDFVKRLIAFPGEEVEIRDGAIFINGTMLEAPDTIRRNYYYNREDWPYGQMGQRFIVPEHMYFVLGDNSAQSSDSRNWGFVPQKNVSGRAFLIWWPMKRVGTIH